MGFATRQPTSNEPPRPGQKQSLWLETDECVDAFALKLNGLARNCDMCKRLTSNKHLDQQGKYPDCR